MHFKLKSLKLKLLKASLKENIKLFSQSILANTEVKERSNNRTTNNKSRRKNRSTTATAKRRGQSATGGPFIPDLLQSTHPILMQSINNLEVSMGLRQQPSYLLPQDMSLTYLLQNPLVHPGQILNEIQSQSQVSENSQKMNLMMEQDFFQQEDLKENFLNEVQIIFNTDEHQTYSDNASSFPSDIQLLPVEYGENRTESISQQSVMQNNQSRRKEILQEIMDNGFIDEPVDEDTAEKNLEQFERTQREDLLRFQKQSTRKIQSELQNTNENYFSQLQNSTFKDRKIYKIKQPKDLSGNQPSSQNNLNLSFSDASNGFHQGNNMDNNNARKRGQKRRKNIHSNRKDKIKVILDTSIDQKIYSTLSTFSGNVSNTSFEGADNLSEFQVLDPLQSNKEEYQLSKLKYNQLTQNEQHILFNQSYINNYKQLEHKTSFQSTSPFLFNELQFLPQSNFLSSDNFPSNLSAIHPLDQLDQIKNALDDIGYTTDNRQNTHLNAVKFQNQIYTTNYKEDKSLNSSFSNPNQQQSSAFSSQIAMVMHEAPFNSEKHILADDFQQVFSNQAFYTSRKDQDSSSNQSKQDQLSQHSQSIKQIQLNEPAQVQHLSTHKQPHQLMQLSESKKNQMISYLPELNTILDPIIEGQTSLMMMQGFQDKSNYEQDEIKASPIYSSVSFEEINSIQTVHNLKNNDRSLSKEATQLFNLIVSKTKEKKQDKLELEKNFVGNKQMKALIFYNLLSLKAANQIELHQKEPLLFSPIEISIVESNL